ncbi:hypothetical protein SSAG_00790 [Streptomyces sp. Mg1]|nr:hypothetical protein SSAG_00790 [Streptomyces sp. Mg1]
MSDRRRISGRLPAEAPLHSRTRRRNGGFGPPLSQRYANEAFAAGDPFKLMRLFGITAQTAMRGVGAACPERTATLPRQRA